MKEFMSKVKEFFDSVWSLVTLAIGALVVGLVYSLRKKQDENNALKAKEQLAEADKSSAILDHQIQEKTKENTQIESELASTRKQDAATEQQRKDAATKEKARSDDEVEEYWKNN